MSRWKRKHHPDSCPACGHTHHGQTREHNWLTCRRCGLLRKARTEVREGGQ
jgi:transcription elongation factor Elf1